MQKKLSAIAFALALTAAPAAYADPSIWVQCDGQPRPEGAATTAARIGAMVFIPIVGLLAAGETGTGVPAAVGQRGVDACTQALAEPVLASFWQRHINILRARAIHYIEIGNHDAALADLVAMRAVGDGQVASPLLDRSVGVSANLLEAALRARNGEIDRARELAIAAADARPHSLVVQQLARGFFSSTPTITAEEQRLLRRELSYEPSYALRLPMRLDQTDDAQAAADAWEAALAAGDHMTAPGLDERLGWTLETGPDGYTLLRAALAMARAGRTARAEELGAQANQKLGPESAGAAVAASPLEGVAAAEADAADSDETLADARRTQLQARVDATLASSAAPYRPLLRAWLAAARGDDAGALAIVQSNFERLPKVMASADLLRRLRQNPSTGAQVPEFLIQSTISGARPDPVQRYREMDLDTLIRVLPQLERVDGAARYRPGRSVGYHESEPKPGQARITYSGAAPYARSEMLLLRAAQLTRERGVDSFLVLSANRAVIDIMYVDSASPAAYASRASRLLRAADVIADLGPIYVDLPAAIEAERRGGRRGRD